MPNIRQNKDSNQLYTKKNLIFGVKNNIIACKHIIFCNKKIIISLILWFVL